MICKHMRLGLLLLFALIVNACLIFNASSLVRAEEHTYSPESCEFQVNMPAPVSVSEAGKGMSPLTKVYIHKGEDGRFWSLAGGLTNGGEGSTEENFDKFLAGVEKGLKEKKTESGVAFELGKRQPASGKGWTGYVYEVKKDGEPYMMQLVAKAESIPVIYILNQNQLDEESHFFSSLVLNQDSINKIYSKDVQLESMGPAERQGYFIGYYVLGPGLLILLIVFIVRAFSKKKNSQQPSQS